jgi:hypothetical protein
MSNGDWKPKLGELFPGHGQTKEDHVERRFREVGFDLALTLQAQTPQGRGDKNDEGQQPQLSQRGAKTTMNTEQQTPGQQIPQNILDQMNALRAAGAQVGLPIIIQLDDKALAALAGKSQPSWGQDLGRFSAKAAIATVLALGGAVTFHFVTKPSPMDMG